MSTAVARVDFAYSCLFVDGHPMTRTFKHLYPQIYDLENLWLAWRKARRGGKRKWASVAGFEFDLEQNLYALRGPARESLSRLNP